MTAPTTTAEITRYTEAVRAALADLSAEDRDDLMEDVEAHLTEVAAEGRGSLEERLGAPGEYAAELRASAGLPVTGPAPRQSWRTGLSAAVAASPLGRGLTAAAGNRQVAAFRAFLPELRPGWWVFRGYLAVWLLAWFTGGGSAAILPRVGGNAVLGFLLMIAAVWASVRLGRHWQVHPPDRGWVVLGTAGAVLLTAFFLLAGGSRSGFSADYAPPAQPVDQRLQLTNIYAFDSDGHPLSGVQLFDQDGNPIEPTGPVFDANGNPVPMQPRFDSAGKPVHNVFPREPVDGAGQARPFAPPFSPPRLAPSAGPSVTASPSQSPGPSPTQSPSASPGVSPAATPR